MNLCNLSNLCGDYERHFVFGTIMSKNKFKFLLSHIMFDDYVDCQKSWSADSFAPIEFLTIDEIYSMRYQIAFCRYNPNKPQKFGILRHL